MRVGSLFTGIGGFDLGFERAGMRTAWFCEKDEFCRRVLAKHWPDTPCYPDVTELRGGDAEPVEVVCGGFPCQPVSNHGFGLAQADERWLWPEFARVIGDLRPRWVVVENVPGLLGRGLGDILGDLAALGYDAEWDCISAASVGAPHLRQRIFLVAYPIGQRVERFWSGSLPRFPEFSWSQDIRGPADFRGRADLPQPVLTRKVDGLSRRMDVPGNALLPQIAEWIGRRIMSAESEAVA